MINIFHPTPGGPTYDTEIPKTIPGESALLSFMAVSICLLLLSLSITLFSTITRQRQEIDKNISALASYIASMDNVISMLENGYPDDSAIEELDSLIRKLFRPQRHRRLQHQRSPLLSHEPSGDRRDLRRRRGRSDLKRKPALHHDRLRHPRNTAARLPCGPQ